MSARKLRQQPLVPEPGQRRIDLDEEADVRNVPADFGDLESQRVLDAVADALVGDLARQAAREDFGRPNRQRVQP